MSIGESAEEFMLIHVLGRETLPRCPVVFPQILSKFYVLPVFHTPAGKVCSTLVWPAPATHHRRQVSTVHQG